jgi:hypothetical protein
MALIKVRKSDGTLADLLFFKGDKGDKGDPGSDGLPTPLAAYPVGALYWSANPTSPASLFGGEWTQITDKFVLAAGSTYAVNAEGGEATHTLTVAEMPSHDHTSHGTPASGASGDYIAMRSITYSDRYPDDASRTSLTGGSAAHNNMPPYIVKYCWQRTA